MYQGKITVNNFVLNAIVVIDEPAVFEKGDFLSLPLLHLSTLHADPEVHNN